MLDECVGGALEQLHLILQEHVDDEYPDLIGACPGDVDWRNATVELEWIDIATDGESCECELTVTVNGRLSFPIVSATTDEEAPHVLASTACRVDGSILATILVKDGSVAEVVLDDDQIETHVV